jgi:hypothetical protein
MTLFCTECGSDNIRTLALVYEHGLTLVSRTGAHITAAASKARPPQRRGTGAPAAWTLVSGLLGLGWHMLWIITAVAALVWLSNASWNANTWPRLYQRWERTFMCERCGAVGEPAVIDAAATAATTAPVLEGPSPVAIGPERPALDVEAGTQKLCPHCRSYIPSSATVCRFCRRDVDAAEAPRALSS